MDLGLKLLGVGDGGGILYDGLLNSNCGIHGGWESANTRGDLGLSSLQRLQERLQRRLEDASDPAARESVMAKMTSEKGVLLLKQQLNVTADDIQEMFQVLEKHKSVLNQRFARESSHIPPAQSANPHRIWNPVGVAMASETHTSTSAHEEASKPETKLAAASTNDLTIRKRKHEHSESWSPIVSHRCTRCDGVQVLQNSEYCGKCYKYLLYWRASDIGAPDALACNDGRWHNLQAHGKSSRNELQDNWWKKSTSEEIQNWTWWKSWENELEHKSANTATTTTTTTTQQQQQHSQRYREQKQDIMQPWGPRQCCIFHCNTVENKTKRSQREEQRQSVADVVADF